MKLSNENQELLDGIYPDGYVVKENVKHNYHVLFIKIFETKGRHNKVNCMVQQINKKDWDIQARMLNKGWKLGAITGYDEFAIIHDPTVKVEKLKPGPKPKEVEPANK